MHVFKNQMLCGEGLKCDAWEAIEVNEDLLDMWALVVQGIKLKIPFSFT